MARPRKKLTADGLAEQAKFVFRGTVVQRGAATLDEVPLTRDTLVVNVDEILTAPDVVKGFEGRPVTVQMDVAQKVDTGRSYVFYTNGWIYGAGLAVRCVGLGADSPADHRKARMAVEGLPLRAMKARARTAELIVSGQVSEVREASRPQAPITEHDPEWREALINVDDVGKAPRGRKPKQVLIRFAASLDVRWARAPKFSVGQAGLWFLGDNKSKKEASALRAAAGAGRNEFVVVDPEDFQPAETAARVKSLLKDS